MSIILQFVFDIDGLVQERHNFIANALELRLSCTNPSIFAATSLAFLMMMPCHDMGACSPSLAFCVGNPAITSRFPCH